MRNGLVLGLCVAATACQVKSNVGEVLSGTSQSLIPANCVFDAKDPFEPHTRLPKGDNKGECYETRKARSLVRLNPQQATRYGIFSMVDLVVANVSHKGKFYVASIPLEGLKAAIFQLEYFPAVVPAGHTQLRLQFEDSKPVTLVSQSAAEPRTEVTVTDLVMSIEALGQPGYKYDVIKGMDDQFGAVYRLTSLEEKYDHMVRKQSHRVEQWKLNLSKQELKTVVRNYIAKSESVGMNLMYHTIKLNCTNELMAAIDDGADYSVRERVRKFFAKATDFYPNVIRHSLQLRRLLPLGKANDLPELALDPVVGSFAQE